MFAASQETPIKTGFIPSLLRFLSMAEKLKCVERGNLLSDGRKEKTADHCWMMGLFALVLARRLRNPVKLERVMELIIVHDLAEALTGDLLLHETIDNPRLKEEKRMAEEIAVRKLVEALPMESAGRIMGLWREYEERKTPEARLTKAIDKLEGFFQWLSCPDMAYWKTIGDGVFYYKIGLGDKRLRELYDYEPCLAEIGRAMEIMTEGRMIEAGMDPAKYRSLPRELLSPASDFTIAFLEFMETAEKLKGTVRDPLLANGERETVGAHCWGLGLMAMLLAPGLQTKVDLGRVLKIVLVHDLAEARTGDIGLSKVTRNPFLKLEKENREDLVMRELTGKLADGMGPVLYDFWREYEENKTPEARFVKGLDKIEATLQSLVYPDISYWGKNYDDIYYAVVLQGQKDKYYSHEGVLMDLATALKELTEEKMLAAGLDVEKYKKTQ